ncbi:MAG TPA: hypothetical protein VFU94_01310 [Conexibacter sp.]|nr:hypothetical protein [Conexibacter sp.]
MLFEDDDGPVSRFRCSVGHAYSLEALVDAARTRRSASRRARASCARQAELIRGTLERGVEAPSAGAQAAAVDPT